MTNFAYLRVSTDHQDAKNQKLGVLDYCNNRGIGVLTFVEDTFSGKSSWRKRAIGSILEKAEKGEIMSYLKKGINKRTISKLVECSPSTLYNWLSRRHIHTKK